MRSNRTEKINKALNVSEEIDMLKTCLRELRKHRREVMKRGLSYSDTSYRIRLHVRTISILEIRLKKLLYV